MKPNRLKEITTTKKGFIQALLFALVGVLVLCYSYGRLTYFGLNPELKSDYLYAVGYGNYRLTFSFVVLAFLFLYAFSLYVVLRKKDINVLFTGSMIFVILVFTGIGGLIVSIKETRLLASYTRDIDYYGLYDPLVEDDGIHWRHLLPAKEDVHSYEYTLVRISSIFGFQDAFSISMAVTYDQIIELEIKNDADFDSNSTACGIDFYDCYYKPLLESNLKTTLYVFISHDKTRIYYVITNQKPTNPANLLFYVKRFINDQRKSPYDN